MRRARSSKLCKCHFGTFGLWHSLPLTSSHQEEGVKFAALYWEEPDRSGHIFGPDNATAMGKALKEVLSLYFRFLQTVSFSVSLFSLYFFYFFLNHSSAQFCTEKKPTLFFHACDSVTSIMATFSSRVASQHWFNLIVSCCDMSIHPEKGIWHVNIR